jgi:hypothetical protein
MSKGRKTCLVDTSLSVEQVQRVFSEAMFGRRSAVTFFMDSGNKWLPFDPEQDRSSHEATISARCSPGIPARLGGPRPRAMVGTVIVLTARPTDDGKGTHVRIQVRNRTLYLGIMPGGVGVGRHLKRIAEAIVSKDPTASFEFQQGPDEQGSAVAANRESSPSVEVSRSPGAVSK